MVVDATGAIVLANPAVSALFGYRPDELTGASVEMLVPDGSATISPPRPSAARSKAPSGEKGSGDQLYGRTRDGRAIPLDLSCAPLRVGGAQFSLAFVRDASDRLRSDRRASAVGEITELLLGGLASDDELGFVLARARLVIEASAAWIVLRQANGSLQVANTDGVLVESLRGFELPANSRSSYVLGEGVVDVVDLMTADGVPPQLQGLGLGPAIYVPFGNSGGYSRPGVLVVARAPHESPFEEFDVTLAGLFAAATSVALQSGEIRRGADAAEFFADQARLCNLLLDSAIQEAFQLRLIFTTMRPVATAEVSIRLDEATERVDRVIRNLRDAVFQSVDQRY